MPIRLAINGYGRIGRSILRALYESGRRDEFEIVAINDPGEAQTHAWLTRFDTVHGRFEWPVHADADGLQIGDDRISLLNQSQPDQLPWQQLVPDVVLECSGQFANPEAAMRHHTAGAPRVLVSQPVNSSVKTIVYGVNHEAINGDDVLLSNASCTSNCLGVLLAPLQQAIGIDSGLLSIVHAYTNDQVLTDAHHEDLRRARSATQSIIPTPTGSPEALGWVIPALAGKLQGQGLRVPTQNVALVDMVLNLSRESSPQEAHELLSQAAAGPLSGLLACSAEPLVSSDYNHDAHSATVDFTLTQLSADQRHLRLCAWYDNEWGYANRMLDTAAAWIKA